MRIGELARRTGLSISRIRFYEARTLLPPAPREANGYRSYSEEAVAALRFVDQAQRLGFTLAEIKRALPTPYSTLPSDLKIVEALSEKRAELDRLIEAATMKKQAINALLAELKSCPPETEPHNKRPTPSPLKKRA